MNIYSTIYVGQDVHKASIMAAYSIGFGEVQRLGNIRADVHPWRSTTHHHS